MSQESLNLIIHRYVEFLVQLLSFDGIKLWFHVAEKYALQQKTHPFPVGLCVSLRRMKHIWQLCLLLDRLLPWLNFIGIELFEFLKVDAADVNRTGGLTSSSPSRHF